MTKLDYLLQSLEPTRSLEETRMRANQALNTYPVDSGVIDNWEEFKAFMARLVCHVENAVLRLSPPRRVNLELDWSRALQALGRQYGGRGEKAGFEMARTGNEGGLYAVLKAATRQMADDYSGNEITARISQFWNALSVSEQMAAAREYLEKYGHLLPSELTEGSAARVVADFPKVLQEHPRLMQRLRRIGR